MSTTPKALLMLVLAGSLAGCIGDDEGDIVVPPPAAADQVPASATASAEAYSRYAATLAPDDQAEPLSLEAVVVAPVSEADEPIDLA
jgi:hypothetical protein